MAQEYSGARKGRQDVSEDSLAKKPASQDAVAEGEILYGDTGAALEEIVDGVAASAGATPTGAMPSVTEVDSKHSNDGSEPNSTDVPMQDMKHTDRQPSPASSEETDRSFSQDVADESLADVPPHDQQDQAPQDDTRSIGVSP